MRPPRFRGVVEIALGQSLIDETYTRALTSDLQRLFDQAPSLLVLNGSGTGFMVEAEDRADAGLCAALSGLLDELVRSEVMIVSVCGGHAVGIGALLLLLSDYRIGVSGTDFRVALEAILGGASLSDGTARFVQEQLSPPFKRRVLMGERIRAQEAVAAGFIDEFCDIAELDARLTEVITRLSSSGSPWRSMHRDRLRALAGVTDANSGSSASAPMTTRVAATAAAEPAAARPGADGQANLDAGRRRHRHEPARDRPHSS